MKLIHRWMEICRGWGMRRKMLLAYAVPVMAVSLIVFVIGSWYILRQVQEEVHTNTDQAIAQAQSYLSYYLQDMEYVAEIMSSDESLLELLSDPEYATAQTVYEGYQEYYKIRKIFDALSAANEGVRLGMYVSDDLIYADNDYYFYRESSLTQREDYGEIEEALRQRGQTFVIMQDKEYSDPSSRKDFLTLLSLLTVACADGTSADYILKVGVPLEDLQKILQNAALSEDSILYLLDRDNNYMFSNVSEEELEDTNSLPLWSTSDWSIASYGGKHYYLIQENLTYSRWKLMSMISVRSYSRQFSWFLLCFLGMIGSVLGCVVLVSSRMARYYTGRIGALNLKMDEVKEGNLITYVEYPEEQGSRDELDQLNGSFDLMIEEVRELMKEQYKLGRSVSQAEMKALQAQINPHFLYNTLDLINWGAMDYGADEVAELARNLGQLYRLSLNHGKSAISIEDEMRHVQAYCNIENIHYEGAIALDVDVPDTIRPFACLNIILQPFVENAIVHGIGEHVEITSCRIAIRAWMENGDIIFSVADDGPGIDPKTAAVIEEAVPGKGSVGYGISNVNFRIKLTYGEEYGVRYVREEQYSGTKALIRIRALSIGELEALTP